MDTPIAQLIKDRLAGRPQTALAKELGISASYLSDIIRGQREPGPTVLEALGLKRVVSYLPESKSVARRRAAMRQ